MLLGEMAVGINSRRGWKSGCRQGGIRLMELKNDLPFLQHGGSTRPNQDSDYFAHVHGFKQKQKISPECIEPDGCMLSE